MSGCDPRVPGLHCEAAREAIGEAEAQLGLYADPEVLVKYEPYRARAEARYALGADLEDVLDDLGFAARCLRRAPVRWLNKARGRFAARRIDPVEIAIATGHHDLAMEIVDSFGLSFEALLGASEDEEVHEEVDAITSFFASGTVVDARDLQGLSQVVHLGLLSGLVREDRKSVGRAVDVWREELEPALVGMPKAARSALDRTSLLVGVSRALLLGRRRAFEIGLAGLVSRSHAEVARRATAGTKALLERGQGSFDALVPATIALGAWSGFDLRPDGSEELLTVAAEIEAWARAHARLDSAA